MRKFRFLFLSAAACLNASLLFAESDGAELFRENKPQDAIPLLEKSISSGNPDADDYNYLGLSYYQIGNYEKSIAAFESGLKAAGTNKRIIAFNAGNSAYAMGNYKAADRYYSLALAAKSDFSASLLNRANARLMSDDLQKSLDDYVNFQIMAPNDPQHDEVERMIALLRGELAKREEDAKIAAEEQQRLQEEEAKLKAEQDRIAAEEAKKQEEARAAEEARRKKLLEDVANSLQDTDTANMSSGAEDVMNYDYESELE